MDGIVYFELNDWCTGEDYPNDEPFTSWMKNDLNIAFNNDSWVKKNKLCVVRTLVDMSMNYCITATRDWILKNCPKLLTGYKEFLRYEDDIQFGTEFKEYCEENIGIWG